MCKLNIIPCMQAAKGYRQNMVNAWIVAEANLSAIFSFICVIPVNRLPANGAYVFISFCKHWKVDVCVYFNAT